MVSLPTVDDVLILWFNNTPLIDIRSEWFAKSDAFDVEIRVRFLPPWEILSTGDTDVRMDMSLEATARIAILDQFSRGMFRGTARAFASDAVALHIAQIVVAAG